MPPLRHSKVLAVILLQRLGQLLLRRQSLLARLAALRLAPASAKVQAEGDARVEGGLRLGGGVDVHALAAGHEGAVVVDDGVDAAVADGLGHNSSRWRRKLGPKNLRDDPWTRWVPAEVFSCDSRASDQAARIRQVQLGGHLRQADAAVGQVDAAQADADDVLVHARDEVVPAPTCWKVTVSPVLTLCVSSKYGCSAADMPGCANSWRSGISPSSSRTRMSHLETVMRKPCAMGPRTDLLEAVLGLRVLELDARLSGAAPAARCGTKASTHICPTAPSNVLSAQVFLTDLADFPQMNAAWDAWVPAGHAPTRATVGGVQLADPGWKVEIVIVAAL
ncbi:hypothetical protein TSOC_005136 [Tetrabaena socialis]|uniref:Uncharacterized protein n=1 Tax=Tetrabaena socialis TaxID=47790 RepID=A0A2J8A743_9CHLO|nr:hypothetical protein TSOC_005136 [Tetrabaena socialis]|eukprot:PNH08315.1 hypothetical protein TSOC_005136 [Tetrabaena socialis]